MSGDALESCVNRILELEARLEAFKPNPKYEYLVVYMCSAGLYHLSSHYYSSLEAFAKASNPTNIPRELVIATGRQKYE